MPTKNFRMAMEEIRKRSEERLDALREWTQANPELAAAWDEAIAFGEALRDEARNRGGHMFSLVEAGVPQRCAEIVANGFEETTAMVAARTFVASNRSFLLLSGGPGTGKTVAAAWTLEQKYVALRWGGDKSKFIRAQELARLSLFEKIDKDFFGMLATVKRLAIDDLGAEMFHDGVRSMIDELLDRRYGARLRTALTTNLAPSSKDPAIPCFKKRYGERIADRIRHDGLVEIVGNKSMRKAETHG